MRKRSSEHGEWPAAEGGFALACWKQALPLREGCGGQVEAMEAFWRADW